MNQQQLAINIHYQNLFAFAGVEVTFTRPSSGESASFTSAIGRRNHEVDSEFGVLTKDTREYICKAADLILNSVTVKPERGDQIQEVIGGETYTFEVYAPNGDDFYEEADPSKLYLRIHTQLIEQA